MIRFVIRLFIISWCFQQTLGSAPNSKKPFPPVTRCHDGNRSVARETPLEIMDFFF